MGSLFPPQSYAAEELAPCSISDKPTTLDTQDSVFPKNIRIIVQPNADIDLSDGFIVYLIKPGGAKNAIKKSDGTDRKVFLEEGQNYLLLPEKFDTDGREGGEHQGKLEEGTYHILVEYGFKNTFPVPLACQSNPGDEMGITVDNAANDGGEDNPPAEPPPKTPCGTNLIGKDGEGYDAETGQCTKVFSGLGVDIPTDPFDLAPRILSIILGIAGAIVIILIIRAGYKLMFSQGNPEKVQEARDELTSAIVGLLFIIFSFVLLQFIANNILNIDKLIPGEEILNRQL